MITKSFAPLTPYLSTALSDRIVFGHNKVITKHQLNYSFIVLPPRTKFNKEISFSEKEHNYVKEINPKKYNLFDNIKWKNTKKCKNHKYKEFMEFAVFKDIKDVCNSNLYYQNPNLYNTRVKTFNLYSVMITSNKTQ